VVTAARSETRSPASADERAAIGKAARAEVPRSSHGDWEPASKRRDPIALLHEQAESRVQELVPIRYGRMVASPFTFYRGAAYVMASDLADSPRSGIRVQLCGDAHLSNFGGFASPERELVFDLNDFDETLPGPWEWDVKRLAASIEVAARSRNFGGKLRRRIVRRAVAEYREAMRRFAVMKAMDVWYARMDGGALKAEFGAQLAPAQVRRFEKTVAKAKAKDSTRAFNKLAYCCPIRQRTSSRRRCTGCSSPIRRRSPATGAGSSRGSDTRTSRERWSASEASEPARGYC
jgi:hypothetical protein